MPREGSTPGRKVGWSPILWVSKVSKKKEENTMKFIYEQKRRKNVILFCSWH